MSGIFPQTSDGGLPPNPAAPTNPTHAYSPTTPPLNTAPLYYGNGCDVRLRPEVVNSLISEVEAICDSASLPYDGTKLTNAERAIRYLVQRGKMKFAGLAGGPLNYTGTLDPPALSYNDGMVLAVVPNQNNTGGVWLSFDGLAYAPLLRHDGAALQPNDFRLGSVYLIAFYAGNWHVCQLVYSQVPVVTDIPKIMHNDVAGWVRPDGNDSTGDGTANSPAKAFRTINGCWNKMAQQYVPSPFYGINIMLGIPGDYEAVALGGFGSLVRIIGDPGNARAYRINAGALGAAGIPLSAILFDMKVAFNGVNFYMNQPNTIGMQVGSGAAVNLANCWFEQTAAGGMFINARTGATVYLMNDSNNNIQGNNLAVTFALYASEHGRIIPNSFNTTLWFTNSFASTAHYGCTTMGLIRNADHVVVNNCGGKKWDISNNSVLWTTGQPVPGDIAGTTQSGGVVDG